MAHSTVARTSSPQARQVLGRGMRVAAFVALAICVALVGAGSSALAGIVFGPTHGALSPATSFAAARATAPATATPASPACHCTGS
ncbi:MAG: hypothetical protein ACM3N4_03005, partial [Nitrososphaerota archaeon]